jgi:hypothetical protein
VVILQSTRYRPLLRLLAFAFLLNAGLLASPALAEVGDITAVASPARLEVGESFIYRVTVNGTGSLPTPTVNLPSAFQIIAGPHSNMNMQFINGRMSSERMLTYRLRALRQGDHLIPSPEVRERGKVIKGNPVTIQVTAPGGAAVSTTAPEKNEPTVPSEEEPAAVNRSDLEPIFLHVEASPKRATVQQPVVITWTLYFQPSVRTYDVRRLASTEGFWSEEWEVPNPPEVVQRTVKGQQFSAAVIHRLVLFPTRSGDLTIGPMEVVVQYEGTRRRGLLDDFFDDSFFGGGLREKQLESRELKLKVDPLPTMGKPDGFDDLVGQYSIDAELDQREVSVNESVLLSVTVRGEGNIGFIPPPEVNVPPDIELYEPEVTQEKQPDAGTITGYKKFQYLLIPRRAGRQKIDPIDLTFFDPERNRYVTRSTPELELNVRSSSGRIAVDEELAGGTPSRVETVGRDIRWILEARKGLGRIAPPVTERLSYWLSYFIPGLVAIAGLAGARLRRARGKREGEVRSRKAVRHARNAMKQARGHLGAGEVQLGYTALAKGIVGYLADRMGIERATLDGAARRQMLEQRGVSIDRIDALEQILALCDSARFTPQGADKHSLEALIERASSWIEAVDKPLSRSR